MSKDLCDDMGFRGKNKEGSEMKLGVEILGLVNEWQKQVYWVEESIGFHMAGLVLITQSVRWWWNF